MRQNTNRHGRYPKPIRTIIHSAGPFRLYAAILAVAALAIGLLAVSLTANRNQTHADTAAVAPAAGGARTRPGNTAEIVDWGRITIFDVYWQDGDKPEDGYLLASSCPPTFEYETSEDPFTGEVTVTGTIRGPVSQVKPAKSCPVL